MNSCIFKSIVMLAILGVNIPTICRAQEAVFNPERDIISLHYDFAPDWDDAESAVADRVILQDTFGAEWLPKHIIAVSGAYGINKKRFRPQSDAVMDAVWGNCCGWISADKSWNTAVKLLYMRWVEVIGSGGEVWIKEGGQSDLTADVVRLIQEKKKHINTQESVHRVQHSDWNENKTTAKSLNFVKNNTDYIRIPDANAFLNDSKGNPRFAVNALADPTYSSMWNMAFNYLDPKGRVDFSDTGELLKILNLEKTDIQAFANHYFDTK